MELDGGIELYKGGRTRYLNKEAPYGRKVRYLQKNGWDSDVKHANNFMEKNEILTVREIYVSGSSSEVEFIDFPDARFNTVMFKDVEDEDMPEIIFEESEDSLKHKLDLLQSGDIFTAYDMVLLYQDGMLHGIVEKPSYVRTGRDRNVVKYVGTRFVYTGIEFTLQEFASIVKWLELQK